MSDSYQQLANQVFYLGEEALWIVMGQILSVAILFGGVRLMTQVMSPFEYGKLAIIMSIVNGALYSVGQGLKMAATRYYSVMADNRDPNWYWDYFLKTIKSAGWVFGLAALLCFFISSGLGNDWAVGLGWSMAVVLAFIVIANAVANGIQNGARNRKIFVFHQVLFDAVRILFAFVLALLLTGSALNAVSGFVAAGCIILASQFYFLLKLKKRFYKENYKADQSRSSQIYSYTWPLLVGGVLGWLQIFSDRWALKSFLSYADVGIYFALYQTMYSFWVYATLMLGNFSGTILFAKVKDGSDATAHMKMLKINEYVTAGYFVLVLICFFFLMPLKEWVSSLLFADEYKAAAVLLPWMALSGGLFGISQQLLYSIYGANSNHRIIPVKTASAVSAIVLHFAGAFFWGVPGVVFGGLCFSCFYMTIALKAHLDEKKIILKKYKDGL